MTKGLKDSVRPPKRGRGRPPSIDDTRILTVAREVFLERGIRATTLEVAERAGVSEGSVFHRFKSKDELFRRAMDMNDDEKLAVIFGQAMQGLRELPLAEGLPLLAERLLEIGRISMPIMMMSWSNTKGHCTGHSAGAAKQKGAFRGFFFTLLHYFETKLREEQCLSVRPDVFARVFLGAVHHYTMVNIISETSPPEDHMPDLRQEEFVSGLCSLLLQGTQGGQQLNLESLVSPDQAEPASTFS